MRRILLAEEGRDSASVPLDELHRVGREIEHIEDGAVALQRILTSLASLTAPGGSAERHGLQMRYGIRGRSDHPEVAFPDALNVNTRAIDTHVRNPRKRPATVAVTHDRLRSARSVGLARESQTRQASWTAAS